MASFDATTATMIRDRETLNVLVDNIARFVRERLIPNEEIVAETDDIPADIVADMKAMGLFGLTIPEAYGGLDLTMEEEVLVLFELCRASPAFRSLIGTTVGIGSQGIVFDGTEAQKRKYLPRLASGELMASFALTEPEAGSDAASLRTTAVRDGDHYVVNGQKTWTTLAQYGDWIFCLVRTDPTAQKQRGISFLLIDMRAPGVTVRPIQLIDGGHEVNAVFFEDVRVPVDQLVGEENKGWTYAKFLLGNERTSNAGVGMIKNRIGRIKRLAGPLLDDDPLFRARLTRLEVETVALEMSVLRVLAREASLPPGTPDPVSSVLKLKGSELQQEASELLVDVLGPSALAYRESGEVPAGFAPLPEGAVDALPTYFNWRKASIYAGSNEVQRGIIAKAILKF
jgi:alkylation response protein AidB-like acyl-CoA dehydrogenase